MMKNAKLGRPKKDIGKPKIISISKDNVDRLDVIRKNVKESMGLDLSYNSALTIALRVFESKQK
jgi:hypothetical protein